MMSDLVAAVLAAAVAEQDARHAKQTARPVPAIEMVRRRTYMALCEEHRKAFALLDAVVTEYRKEHQ